MGGQDRVAVLPLVEVEGAEGLQHVPPTRVAAHAAEALLDHGAVEVMAYISHGVLSGGAVERVNNSALEKLIITDSILATPEVTGSAVVW